MPGNKHPTPTPAPQVTKNPAVWVMRVLTNAGVQAFPADAGDDPPIPHVVFTQTSEAAALLDEAPFPLLTTFEFELYADSYGAVHDLADKLRGVLHGYEIVEENTHIEAVIFQSEADSPPAYDPGRDRPVYVMTQSFLFHWTPTI